MSRCGRSRLGGGGGAITGRCSTGALWKLRTGAPWRDLPERYGPWKTPHERLRPWTADSTWDRLLAEVIVRDDAVGEAEWVISVDSSVVRAHQHAAEAGDRPGRAAGRAHRRFSDRRRYEACMALGVLLDQIGVALPDDGTGDRDVAAHEVNVAPAQRTELSAAGSGHRGEAEEHREVRVIAFGGGDEQQDLVRV